MTAFVTVILSISIVICQTYESCFSIKKLSEMEIVKENFLKFSVNFMKGNEISMNN